MGRDERENDDVDIYFCFIMRRGWGFEKRRKGGGMRG